MKTTKEHTIKSSHTQRARATSGFGFGPKCYRATPPAAVSAVVGVGLAEPKRPSTGLAGCGCGSGSSGAAATPTTSMTWAANYLEGRLSGAREPARTQS